MLLAPASSEVEESTSPADNQPGTLHPCPVLRHLLWKGDCVNFGKVDTTIQISLMKMLSPDPFDQEKVSSTRIAVQLWEQKAVDAKVSLPAPPSMALTPLTIAPAPETIRPTSIFMVRCLRSTTSMAYPLKQKQMRQHHYHHQRSRSCSRAMRSSLSPPEIVADVFNVAMVSLPCRH